MTGMELTIITAVAFILFAFERLYSSGKATNHCLERIEGLLTEIKDDAGKHHQDTLIREGMNNIENSLDNITSNLADIENILDNIDAALHGDYANPRKQELNSLKRIGDGLNENKEELLEIRSSLERVNLALEPARLRSERRWIRNVIEFSNMVDGASCGKLSAEEMAIAAS